MLYALYDTWRFVGVGLCFCWVLCVGMELETCGMDVLLLCCCAAAFTARCVFLSSFLSFFFRIVEIIIVVVIVVTFMLPHALFLCLLCIVTIHRIYHKAVQRVTGSREGGWSSELLWC